MKSLTRDQLQSRKEQAVRFVRDVLGDPERAEEIEGESLEDYAERRKIHITNPSKRSRRMATKQELEEQVRELESENQELQDQLDAIADIVTGDEEDESADDDQDDAEDDSQD